jgi:hypothetical protein
MLSAEYDHWASDGRGHGLFGQTPREATLYGLLVTGLRFCGGLPLSSYAGVELTQRLKG